MNIEVSPDSVNGVAVTNFSVYQARATKGVSEKANPCDTQPLSHGCSSGFPEEDMWTPENDQHKWLKVDTLPTLPQSEMPLRETPKYPKLLTLFPDSQTGEFFCSLTPPSSIPLIYLLSESGLHILACMNGKRYATCHCLLLSGLEIHDISLVSDRLHLGDSVTEHRFQTFV